MEFNMKYIAEYVQGNTTYTLSEQALEEIAEYYSHENAVKKVDVKKDPTALLESLVDIYYSKMDIPWPQENHAEVRKARFGQGQYKKILQILITVIKNQRYVLTMATKELNKPQVSDGQNQFRGFDAKKD